MCSTLASWSSLLAAFCSVVPQVSLGLPLDRGHSLSGSVPGRNTIWTCISLRSDGETLLRSTSRSLILVPIERILDARLALEAALLGGAADGNATDARRAGTRDAARLDEVSSGLSSGDDARARARRDGSGGARGVGASSGGRADAAADGRVDGTVADVLWVGVLVAYSARVHAVALAGLVEGVVAAVEVLALVLVLGEDGGLGGELAVEAEEALLLWGEGLWRGKGEGRRQRVDE